MNREEILEKSRRENKGTDEMELIVLNSAQHFRDALYSKIR